MRSKATGHGNRGKLAGSVATGVLAIALAVAPAADAKKALPSGNTVVNPSFAQSTAHWGGVSSRIKRVRTRRAPHGMSVARVGTSAGGSAYTIDDSAPAASTEAGAVYRASAYVRATRASRRKKVGIVIREMTPAGEFVADRSATVRLNARFRKLTVSLTAAEDGNLVDVYLRRADGVRPRDSFLVDLISLVRVNDPPADDPPADDPPAGSPVTTSQVALVTSHESVLFQNDGSKYAYIMVRDNLHNRIAELRSVHPESKILLYKNVAFTLNEPGCPYYPFQGTGVSYCDADSHENWFLHRKGTSQRLSSSSYPAQRAMDIGNPAYQQEWVDEVLARMNDANNDGSGVKYDGVWMDDTNLYPGHGMDGQIAGMTDAQYREAMVEFVDNVSPQLEAAGVLSVPNLGMDPWDAGQRAAAVEVAGDVSMVNREGLVRWGESGTTWTEETGDAPFWKWEVELAEDMQAAGAEFHAMTYGASGDVQTQRYARATFLMAWDGSDGSAYNYRTSNGNDWTDEWTVEIGTPTGDRTKVGQGWKRNFTGGVAVINTRPSGSQSFQLGGSFRQADGSCVSQVTIGATRAMVMPAC